MPAPTNISAATAIEIGPLPNSITQDVNFGGTTFTVWYKYTAVLGDNEIGIWGFGDLVIYQPRVDVFSPDGVTPYLGGFNFANNKPIQLPVTAGQVYYFSFTSQTGDVSPAILTLSGLAFTDQTVPVGSLAVNDDTNGFPLALLSSVGAATPLRYVQGFPAGEEADILSDGTLLVEDISESGTDVIKVALFSPPLTLLASIPFAASSWQQSYIRGNKVDRFYVGWDSDFDHFSGEPSFRTISRTGVSSGWTALAGSGMTGLAPSNDETILYYSGRIAAGNRPVKRWDLVNNLPLADFAANVAGYTPSNILVLADNSVVVLYFGPLSDVNVLRYSPAGTLLNTYPFGVSIDPRLAYAIDDTTFWVWTKAGAAQSLFHNIRASDGAELNLLLGYQFEQGVYRGAAANPAPARFGHSESCPFWITRTEIGPIIPPTPGPPGCPAGEFPMTLGSNRPGCPPEFPVNSEET